MSAQATLRRWVKRREHPLADALFRCAKGAMAWSFPVIPALHRPLYGLHRIVVNALGTTSRVLWYTPLFQSRCEKAAPGLYLYGGMPLVLGPVAICLGSDCRVSGQTTISGRTASVERPQLSVGRNVDIGWQTTIAVGRKIRIGNNVRIAGRAFLAGYPGHPLDAQDRAAGLPDTDDQIGDIILEDDVWLATNVTVSAGVRIGAGTVVAAGSVVTHDLPPHVLAGGVPARIIKQIKIEGAANEK